MKTIVAALLLSASIASAAVGATGGRPDEDKELQILLLQKIIAEQSMNQLLRDELVKEYARIRANYEKLNAEIAAKEKANEKKTDDK